MAKSRSPSDTSIKNGHMQFTAIQTRFFEYNVKKEEAQRIKVFLNGHEPTKPGPIVSARVRPPLAPAHSAAIRACCDVMVIVDCSAWCDLRCCGC